MSQHQRIRIRYTKEGRPRFVSARDLTSVWERALRRADLPILYSEGYTPHPKVSFPDALPVGYASTGEYAELTFAAPIDPGPALARLSATLPEGMTILTYFVVPDGAPKLARMLAATMWEIELPGSEPALAQRRLEVLREAGERFLARDSVEVARPRPGGATKIRDARRPVLQLRGFSRPARDDATTSVSTTTSTTTTTTSTTTPVLIPVLRAVLRNDGPAVRPTDLHNALFALAPTDVQPELLPPPRLFRRVAQGDPVDDGIREALSQEPEPIDPTRHAEAA